MVNISTSKNLQTKDNFIIIEQKEKKDQKNKENKAFRLDIVLKYKKERKALPIEMI